MGTAGGRVAGPSESMATSDTVTEHRVSESIARPETPRRSSEEEPVEGRSVIPFNQIFEVLRNQRRRFVLRYLARGDDQVRLGDLAEQIAAWENGKSRGEITSNERKRVYVGLYQCHLPKMDSVQAIEFNKPRGLIRPGPRIEVFLDYLDRDRMGSESWHLVYLAVSLTSFSALAFVQLADPFLPFPIMDGLLGIVVFGFVLVSATNTWRVRRSAD